MVLISGDRDFSSIVNFMHQVGYSVILVYGEKQLVHSGILFQRNQKALSTSATHEIYWNDIFQPTPEIQISVDPSLRKLMAISEMHRRVSYVTGQSFSQNDLYDTIPQDIDTSQYLLNTGFNSVEFFIPPLRDLRDKSYGDNWIREVDLNELDINLIKTCEFNSRLHWAYLSWGLKVIRVNFLSF